MARARCAEPDIDPTIFQLEVGQSADPARAVCRHCPVAPDCLEWALSSPSPPGGVLAATTERERRQMRRYRRLQQEQRARA